MLNVALLLWLREIGHDIGALVPVASFTVFAYLRRSTR